MNLFWFLSRGLKIQLMTGCLFITLLLLVALNKNVLWMLIIVFGFFTVLFGVEGFSGSGWKQYKENVKSVSKNLMGGDE